MIFNYFKKFFYLFADYKKAFIKYAFISTVAAFLELFGVALTYPFVLKLLSGTNDKNGIKSAIVIGIIIIALFIFKNVFMICFIYVQTKFKNRMEIMIKKRLMNFFLISNYKASSKISLAEKGKIIGLLVSNIMNNFVLRLLNLNINLLIFCCISVFVAIKFPVPTALSVLCASILIKFQNHIYKPLLTKIAANVSSTASINSQAYNEAVLNIKSVKISNNEKYFYDNYAKTLNNHYNNCQKLNFLNTIPPFIIEPFAIILLFVLLTVIMYQNISSPEKLVASFALVATAIFRLTPAISRIQVNLNGINAAIPMVDEFIEFYEKNNIKNLQEIKSKYYTKFKESIEFKNVFFEYEKDKPVLKNINLKIAKGEFIGIAGLSGVGKTTLADLIAGLYKPTSGEIIIDGKTDFKNLKIGYIPQEMTLISGSIKDNVAFGNKNIDDDKIIASLKEAQLYDFIEKNYPDGIYAKPITDSIGLSQGQKQRLAIARALYSEPDILILDEATSSLDLKTEDEICNVLNKLKGDKTIIVIAHRLSTIKNSERIIFMENGSISSVAGFDELINISEGFNNLVKIAFKNTESKA